MATAGMQNLNAPATEPGPLTAADLPQWRTDGVDIDAIHRGHQNAGIASSNIGLQAMSEQQMREKMLRDGALAQNAQILRAGYWHPSAAEAATDVGQEDDLGAARGIVLCIPAALLAWALIAAAAVTWKFWPF